MLIWSACLVLDTSHLFPPCRSLPLSVLTTPTLALACVYLPGCLTLFTLLSPALLSSPAYPHFRRPFAHPSLPDLGHLNFICAASAAPHSIVDLVRRLELGSGYATDLRHAHSQVRPDSAALDPLDREDGRTGGGWCAPVRTSSCCAPPLPQGFAPLYAPARTELEMWTWAVRLEGRRRRSGASWGADSLAASSRACSGTLVFSYLMVNLLLLRAHMNTMM